MVRAGVGISMKRNLCWFIESQTHVGTLACQNEFDSMNQYTMFFLQTSTTTSVHALKTYQTWKVLDVKQPTPNQKY